MEENSPNLAKKIDIQVQEDQRIPNKLETKRNAAKHIIIKLQKIKDRDGILKVAREKNRVTYKGVPLRLSADFSKETLQASRGWKEVFKVMKKQVPSSKVTLSRKAIILNGRQIKCLTYKVKLKEFIITKPLLYEMLKGLI